MCIRDRGALVQFSVEDTIDFFREIGIYPLNRNGYLYPRSNQAQSVVDVLCMEAASLGVKIKTNEQVTEIKNGINGKNFRILTKGWHYDADALILANGSQALSLIHIFLMRSINLFLQRLSVMILFICLI